MGFVGLTLSTGVGMEISDPPNQDLRSQENCMTHAVVFSREETIWGAFPKETVNNFSKLRLVLKSGGHLCIVETHF